MKPAFAALRNANSLSALVGNRIPPSDSTFDAKASQAPGSATSALLAATQSGNIARRK